MNVLKFCLQCATFLYHSLLSSTLQSFHHFVTLVLLSRCAQITSLHAVPVGGEWRMPLQRAAHGGRWSAKHLGERDIGRLTTRVTNGDQR